MNITNDVTLLRLNQNNMVGKTALKQTPDAESKEVYNKNLKKACDGFEELFVHKLLQVMRETTEKSGFISGGRGEEIFQDMLDENYAKLITKTGTLGLSDLIFEHTKKS